MAVAALAAACGGSSHGGRIKVGLVTDVGQSGVNRLASAGLLRAEKQLGVEGRVLEPSSAADYASSLSKLASQGYDLVIGIGLDQAAAVDKVARDHPKTHFAIVDVDQQTLPDRPKNVLGLLFREQEAGYLAGYLAGFEAKRLGGPQVVGSVGGQKQPPVDRYIAGFQAGARAADPGVKTLNGYSDDWVDRAKCRQLALRQIAAGAKVVFQVAGACGLGALAAAGEKHVWGIGADADQAVLGPQILTSALKHVDTAVFQAVRAVKNGAFEGGTNTVFGLDSGGVALGKVSPRVPPAALTALRAIETKIKTHRLGNIPTVVG